MKIQKIIRKVLLPLLGLVGIFVLTVITINLAIFDEEINPEIIDLMQPRTMIAENENAYFAIWGLVAASDRDMMSAGIGIIDRYLTNRDKNSNDEIFAEDYDEFFGGEGFDKQWLETYSRCSSRTEYGCLQKMSAQLVATPVQSERLELMLNRYAEIMQMTKYQQINSPSIATPLPAYSPILRLNQINLAQHYNQNENELFIKQAKASIKFWKMVLVQSDFLIEKMIAIASIWNNIQYLSEFIQSRDLSKELQIKVAMLLEPLTREELDLSEAFIAEAKMLYRSLPNLSGEEIDAIFESKVLPLNWLLQANATNNSHYVNFLKPIIVLSKQSKEQFYQSAQSSSLALNETFKVNFNPANLYNLVGKMLLNFSIWSPTDYIARVHDLNGMISVVKLQLQLKDSAKDSVGSLINQSAIKNPYTGKAMDYDAENNWLGFDCLGKSVQCRVKL